MSLEEGNEALTGIHGILQVRLRSLMIGVGAIGMCCAVARFSPYAGVMLAFFLGNLALLARIAGPVRGRLVLTSLSASVYLFLIASWPTWKYGMQALGLYASRPKGFESPQAVRDWFGSTLKASPWLSQQYAWESWSLARWVLMFGLMAWMIQARSRGRLAGTEVARALLAFTPWLALLELGTLAGVWLASGTFRVVTEPNTIFAMFPEALWFWANPEVVRFWVLRMSLPSFFVGLAYFRSVARWDWKRSAMGAVLLIPLSIVVSIAWSCLYLGLMDLNVLP